MPIRSEAKGVPHLLVAPRPPSAGQSRTGNDIQDNCLDDRGGGYYADGAYTAIPDTNLPSSSNQDAADAQDLYYDSLSSRFRLLHATLKCNPPLSAIEALHSSSLISLPPDTETARSQWRHHVQSSDPLMVQIACMDAESVLEVVKLLTGTMAQIIRSRSMDKVLRFGAWVWGVLGKCRDRTELGSDEIAVLRELGKRAVTLLVGIRDKARKAKDASQELSEKEGEDVQEVIPPDEPAAETVLEDSIDTDDARMQRENLDDDGSVDNEQDAAALEAAKKRLQNSFLSTSGTESRSERAVAGGTNDPLGANGAEKKMAVDQQVRATLDVILTIVGEFYGQRDLLDFRDIWGEV
jgi:Survival motor neuron (SMN) interacting protein 1 (SIP1)